MNRTPHVAIVGATGAVGVEMIRTLEKRKFPVGKLTLLASARSAGKTMPFKGTQLPVQEFAASRFFIFAVLSAAPMCLLLAC